MTNQNQISHMAYPAYAEKWAKLQTLRQDLTAIETDIETMLSAMAPHVSSDETANRRAKLLGDPVTAADESALDRKKLSALCERRRDLFAVIEEQERRVELEQSVVDQDICAQVKPEHDALAAAMCKALITLHGHMKAYGSFVDQLNGEGVAWSGRLRPAQLRPLGDPNDKHSRLALYLDDMAQYGIIRDQDIPAELRHERTAAVPALTAKSDKRRPQLVRSENEWSEVA